MKKSSKYAISAIAMLASVSVWTNSNAHGSDESESSMMNESEGSVMMGQGASKNRTTTGDRHIQHYEGATMGEGGHGMMMGNYQMGQHQHPMSPMNDGKGGMMSPETMQNHQQHMDKMEQRLANIEALLTRLVEQQKP